MKTNQACRRCRGHKKEEKRGHTHQGRPCGTNYLDAGGATFTHGVGHGGARRVDHGDEAQEAELLGGEVHVVAVEGIASRELGRRQVQVAKAWEGEGGVG